jgi:hypothetical protein
VSFHLDTIFVLAFAAASATLVVDAASEFGAVAKFWRLRLVEHAGGMSTSEPEVAHDPERPCRAAGVPDGRRSAAVLIEAPEISLTCTGSGACLRLRLQPAEPPHDRGRQAPRPDRQRHSGGTLLSPLHRPARRLVLLMR